MGQAIVGAETVCVVYLAFYAFHRMLQANIRSYFLEPPTPVDYLFKISRVTGESEYSIFAKSAENWPVNQAMVERDFRRYLSHQVIPHYVHDFMRKNKEHLAGLRMPIFLAYAPHSDFFSMADIADDPSSAPRFISCLNTSKANQPL